MRPHDRPGYVDENYLKKVNELLQPAKQLTYQLLRLGPGTTVLDVGCGPGTDTIPLAQLVGSAGHVTGLDTDWQMIELAGQRAAQAGVAEQVTHEIGDATAMPYDDDRFDATRSERVFQHVLSPEQVLAEMVRVTRPGGRVVVADADWTSASIDQTDIDLDARLRQVWVTRVAVSGESGRQLYRLFKHAGLVDVEFELLPLVFTDYKLMRFVLNADRAETAALKEGVVTQAELEVWRDRLQQADAAGEFFAYIVGIVIGGTKPD